jgi:hypothetical protein
MVYGPKHIAIPNHKVNVGARYNLNREGYGHPVIHKKKLSVAHLNGNPKIHGAGIYPTTGIGHRFPGTVSKGIPFPIVSFNVLNAT